MKKITFLLLFTTIFLVSHSLFSQTTYTFTGAGADGSGNNAGHKTMTTSPSNIDIEISDNMGFTSGIFFPDASGTGSVTFTIKGDGVNVGSFDVHEIDFGHYTGNSTLDGSITQIVFTQVGGGIVTYNTLTPTYSADLSFSSGANHPMTSIFFGASTVTNVEEISITIDFKLAGIINNLELRDITLNNLTAPSAGDSDPPGFTSGPIVSSETGVGFDLDVTIDETGDIFYVVVFDNDTAPTVANVLDGNAFGGGMALASGSALNTTTLDATITGLPDGGNYHVYVVAQDDESPPNVQAAVTEVDAATNDVTDPAVVISSAFNDPDNQSTIIVTVDFSEDVSGFSLDDIVETNVNLSNLNTSNDSTYFFDASPQGDGAVSIQVGASTVTDAAANNNTPSNTISYTYDGTGPTPTVSTTSSDPTSDNPIPVTITFGEVVGGDGALGFKENEITVTNGTTSDFASGDSVTYTVNVTPSGDGTVTVKVNAGVTADEAGNSNLVSNTLSLEYDGTPSQASVSDAAENEGTTLTFTISLDNPAPTGGATIDYTTSNGTATAGTDYTSASSTVTFLAGEDTKTVDVTVSSDDVVEADETFTMTLSNPTGFNVSIDDATGTGTITNEDQATVTITDRSANENDGSVAITVTVDKAVDGGFSVRMSTADGTATTGDSDYSAVTNQQITFAGTASEPETFNITLGGDTKVEAAETIGITMGSLVPNNVNSDDIDISDTGQLTVDNDDQATVTIANESGNEDDGAVTFTATLDVAVDGGFDVDVSTTDGTATTADTDYTAVTNQTLTFSGSAGETETFTVTPTADADLESDETVTVSMSGLAPVTVASGDIDITDNATLTINNDEDISFSVNDPSISEGDSGTTTLQFTVTLSQAAPAGGASVDYATSDGTASSASDYTAIGTTNLSFSVGETSKTVDIDISGDAVVENDETITLTLSNPTGTDVVIGDATGTGTITNDDVDITSVTLPNNDTYVAGENIDFTLNFSESVTVTGSPQLALTIGSSAVNASYQSGSPGTALVFRYTVQSNDLDNDGITAGTLSLNSGTINSTSLDKAAQLTLPTLGSTAGILVDAVDPIFTSVTDGDDGTYIAGETITITVVLDAPGYMVTGDLSVLDSDFSSTQAFSDDGGGTYSFTTAALDAGGNMNEGSAIAVTITAKDGADNSAQDNSLSLDLSKSGPAVTSVTVPSNDTYIIGQDLDFVVNYGDTLTVVNVSGTPQLPLTIGSSSVNADYVSGDGSGALTFTYTVQAGDLDTNGIEVGTQLNLNSGTITSSSGNPAGLDLNGVGSTTGVLVDGVVPSAPSTPDLEAASDTCSSNTDNITDDTTPTFTGTAEANATVNLISSIDSDIGSTTADGSGNWTITVSSALTPGNHNITATATDVAGNTGPASNVLAVSITTLEDASFSYDESSYCSDATDPTCAEKQ